MYKLYGIPNCDTVKKVRRYLDEINIDYEFIDFKKTPPKVSWLKSWKKQLGAWPVNPKGRTFKQIKDAFEGMKSESDQCNLLADHSSSLKRPILELDGQIICLGNDRDLLEKLGK